VQVCILCSNFLWYSCHKRYFLVQKHVIWHINVDQTVSVVIKNSGEAVVVKCGNQKLQRWPKPQMSQHWQFSRENLWERISSRVVVGTQWNLAANMPKFTRLFWTYIMKNTPQHRCYRRCSGNSVVADRIGTLHTTSCVLPDHWHRQYGTVVSGRQNHAPHPHVLQSPTNSLITYITPVPIQTNNVSTQWTIKNVTTLANLKRIL